MDKISGIINVHFRGLQVDRFHSSSCLKVLNPNYNFFSVHSGKSVYLNGRG